jgi:hypothetical protein
VSTSISPHAKRGGSVCAAEEVRAAVPTSASSPVALAMARDRDRFTALPPRAVTADRAEAGFERWYKATATSASRRVLALRRDRERQAGDEQSRTAQPRHGPMLPDDARPTSLNGDTSEVWNSAELKLLTGTSCAALTTTAGTDTGGGACAAGALAVSPRSWAASGS